MSKAREDLGYTPLKSLITMKLWVRGWTCKRTFNTLKSIQKNPSEAKMNLLILMLHGGKIIKKWEGHKSRKVGHKPLLISEKEITALLKSILEVIERSAEGYVIVKTPTHKIYFFCEQRKGRK